MKYLVVSEDALKDRIRSSEHFPCVVEGWMDEPARDILARVFRDRPFQPRDGKTYVIIPIHADARKATFRKPRPQFDVVERSFFG